MNLQKIYPLMLACLAFVTLSITSCSEDEIASKQLIVNGNVENGSTSPDAWRTNSSNQDNFSVVWTDEESYSGNKSISIATQTADATNFVYWSQTVSENLPYGESLTLNVRIKADLSGSGVTIVLRGDDTVELDGGAEQFVTSQQTEVITGVFDWKEYSIKLNNVESSTKSLTVFLLYLNDTSGKVYFDDISLTY